MLLQPEFIFEVKQTDLARPTPEIGWFQEISVLLFPWESLQIPRWESGLTEQPK